MTASVVECSTHARNQIVSVEGDSRAAERVVGNHADTVEFEQSLLGNRVCVGNERIVGNGVARRVPRVEVADAVIGNCAEARAVGTDFIFRAVES